MAFREIPEEAQLRPRRWAMPILAFALVGAIAWLGLREVPVGAERPSAEKRKRLATVADVRAEDGINAAEAGQIARAFYLAAFGSMEGFATEPVEKDGYWTSTVRKGFVGAPDSEPIVINPRTGAVSGPAISRFTTFEAFKRFLADGRRSLH